MSLFDSCPREPDRGARPADRAFAYLNGSGRPEGAAVRDVLDGWLERYPAAHRAALVARLRREDEHDTAFFELALHEWAVRRGMEIEAVEPEVPGTRRTPDFRV